jgi:hypothetical protein
MKNACAYLMKNKVVVGTLAAWVVFLMLFSLFYGTSGLKEGLDSLWSSAPVPVDPEQVASAPSGLNFFENSTASPEHCPSAYSTSTGCIQLNDYQTKMLATRGGNRTSGFY